MRSRLLCMVILAVSIPAHAQDPKTHEPPKTFDLDAIDAYIAGVVREKKITGLSIAIVRDSKIVFSKGYGKRSLEKDLPVESNTLFEAGSVTKQLTCACILRLAEQGGLSVDDKVEKYFPNLTRAGDITLYQLMTHTSGYPDYYPLDFVDRRLSKPRDTDSIITEYAGGKLDFEPGTQWSYSNTGYLILGRVIEKVSDSPFGECLRRQIFEPVGMKDSAIGGFMNVSIAQGYTPFALEPLQPAIYETANWLHAAGGLWTTASDIARWDIALMEGRILKPGSMRLMTSPVALSEGKFRDYGCGLNIRRENGGIILSHGGAVSGFRASNTIVPRSKSAIVLLINDEQSEPALAQTILGLLPKPEIRSIVPKVEGVSAKDAALDFFHQMQAGELDRKKLGEEFSVYLNDERVKAAAPRLKELGEPEKVEILGTSERGGLEVASVRLTFKSVVLKGPMYRSVDGKIQQLLFVKD